MFLQLIREYIYNLMNNVMLFFFWNIDHYTSHKNLPDKKWLYYLVNVYPAIKGYSKLSVNLMIIFLFFVEWFIKCWNNLNGFFKNFLSFCDSYFLIFTGFFYLHRYVCLKTNIVYNDRYSSHIREFSKQLYHYKPQQKNLLFIVYFLYNFTKTVLVALLVTYIIFLYLIYYYQLQFLKQLAIWFVILNLFFWLISGFNFFLKRYRFGKFTTAIQRFWKRTNMCFWLIEGFLFLIFFYYFLNSSQEPLYMYDAASLNQEYLFPLKSSYLNISGLSLIIFILTYTMLSINMLVFSQFIFIFSILSIFIFFTFFIESYQFYYVITLFNEASWVFSEENSTWELEFESPRLRTKEYYFLMCLIAKYWHFLFIFLSWVFFIMKVFEGKRVTYNLLAVNLQNFIILYVLNLLCYVQWLKWVFRRFFDAPFFWFFLQPDITTLYILIQEIYLLVWNIFNFDILLFSYNSIDLKTSLIFFEYGDTFNYFQI